MPPDPVPPLPIAGTFEPATGEMRLTFDQDLVVGVLDDRNWELIGDSHDWATDETEIFAPEPRVVVGIFSQEDPRPPGNLVDYSAGVPDLVGQNGLPVAAFADFPLTLI